MDALTIRLRQWCETVRRRPSPLADAIPMVQEAAATIEATSVELTRLRAESERLRIELENTGDTVTSLRSEVALYRGESDKFRALLNYVPLPPVAITYERGWKLIDMLQAAAIAQEKP